MLRKLLSAGMAREETMEKVYTCLERRRKILETDAKMTQVSNSVMKAEDAVKLTLAVIAAVNGAIDASELEEEDAEKIRRDIAKTLGRVLIGSGLVGREVLPECLVD